MANPSLFNPTEPKTPNEYYKLGKAYAKMCDFKKAINLYSEAIEIDSEFITAYLTRGGNYSDIGQFDMALNDYEKVLELNPDKNTAYLVHYYRGITYTKLNDVNNAISDFEHALELTDDPISRKWLEKELNDLGRR